MRNLLKILHNSSGASMMMALLLLLVALMVSAVIIAAAFSSALSLRSDRAQQQAYLTVSSAAELMRDKLAGGSCHYETVEKRIYTSENRLDTPIVTTSDKHANGAFSKILYAAIEHVQTYDAPFRSKTYTITAENYDPVTMDVFLKREADLDGNPCYRLTVWFTGGQSPNQCRLVLTMDGLESTETSSTVLGSGDTRRFQDILTTTIDWQNASIQRKEASDQ